MSKQVLEKIGRALMSAGITFVAGLALKRAWKYTTGNEPPNPEDPQVPTGHAITWFLVSGVGVGLVQLLFQRSLARRRPELDHKQSMQNS